MILGIKAEDIVVMMFVGAVFVLPSVTICGIAIVRTFQGKKVGLADFFDRP